MNKIAKVLALVGLVVAIGCALAAVGFWLCAIGLAVWWERLAGQGPLERWYRAFGG